MSKSKGKVLCILLFVLLSMCMFNKSYASTEKEDNLIYKIAPDGKTATFKTIKPQNLIQSDIYLTNIVNYLLNDEDYVAYACCTDESLTKCKVSIYKNLIGNEELVKEYIINVNYDEPKENKEIDKIAKKFKPFNDMDLETYYRLNDLNLINYYNTSNKSELWFNGAPGRALKYSEDIIKMSEGCDVSFYISMRAGATGDDLMYEYAFGEMSLFYEDYIYAHKQQGIHLQRVIYIPQNTENTKEAYINAAQERINDYLGTDKEVVVTYGGTLESLANLDSYNEDESVPRNTTDGNYYNITVKGRTYKFYIIKASSEKLKKPTYKGKHLKSNIEITTDSATVPLDTYLVVTSVSNNKIDAILGTNNYTAFDISLYSNSKKANITKLNNGKFLVSIPVNEELNGKTITTYYLNSNDEVEEYETTVKDNIASFETNHFSTYILAEKVEKNQTIEQPKEEIQEEQHILDEEPRTGIINIASFVSISVVISFIGFLICKKKIYK